MVLQGRRENAELSKSHAKKLVEARILNFDYEYILYRHDIFFYTL